MASRSSDSRNHSPLNQHYAALSDTSCASKHSSSPSHVAVGRHSFKYDDFTFGYVVRGNGPLLIIQCAGLGFGSKYLQRTLTPLEKHYKLLYFDPRGTGRSSRPKDVTKMGSYDMAGDLELLRLALGVEKLSLFGHSNGGTIVLAYAELFPDRVDKLVLVGNQLLGFDGSASSPGLKGEQYQEPYMRLEQIEPTSDENFGQYMREFVPSYFYNPENGLEALLMTLQDNPCAWCLEHNGKCNKATGTRQIDGLKKIKADTLIVVGKYDMAFSPAVAEATKGGIGGNAELVVLEECGHFPWIEKEEEFWELLLDFMARSRQKVESEELTPGGHPIGVKVDTTPALRPPRTILHGRSVLLERLNPSHADDLFDVVGGENRADLWDYMPNGPFLNRHSFRDYIAHFSGLEDPFFYAVISKTTYKPVGHTSFLRIDTSNRCIEVGFIMFSPLLQRTTAATECMYLMAHTVFEALGYRRYEWKCNNLNAPSKRAAERLGFTFEGVFRQHMITKSRNRDTAWFSMLDIEWPSIKRGFERWLDPSNFDEQGNQKIKLEELRIIRS